MNLRLGRWSQPFAPGYSTCERCGTPWKFVENHTTYYIEPSIDPPRVGWGMFALCEKCWGELRPLDRVPYYRKAWGRWKVEAAEEWLLLYQAVLEGK